MPGLDLDAVFPNIPAGRPCWAPIMPIYEYRCDSCGHQFDALQKLSDDPLRDCPKCGESALKKMLSAPSFQLKGTGWYETDFKDKKKDNESTGESSSSSSSPDSASSSSDSSSSKSDASSSSSDSKSSSASSSSTSSSSASAD